MPRGVYERSRSGVGPSRRGVRVPPGVLPTSPPEPETESSGDPVYVCTARPLKVGTHTLYDGVEVPGAGKWLRLDSWVNARRVRKIKADEDFTPYDEFLTRAQYSSGAEPEE